MPHNKIANLSGVGVHQAGKEIDHHPQHTAYHSELSEAEMREFLKEEQREGMHPSLKGKHF